MKNQALFSWKDTSKKLKCCLLQFSFGALNSVGILSEEANLLFFLPPFSAEVNRIYS